MAHGDAWEGKWRGKMWMEWVALYVGTQSIQLLSADPHSSAASSQLNWHPRRFKWTHPFRWKTKSGFCTCAITFRTCYTSVCIVLMCHFSKASLCDTFCTLFTTLDSPQHELLWVLTEINLLKLYILTELHSALMTVHDLLKQSDAFGLHGVKNQDKWQSAQKKCFTKSTTNVYKPAMLNKRDSLE